MRFGAHVRVIADRSHERVGVARAMAAIAQAFALDTTLIRAESEDDLRRCAQHPADLTILSCHGVRDGHSFRFDWQVGRRLNAIEWTTEALALRPAELAALLGRGRGALLSLACHSGCDPAMTEAAHAAGFAAYIAPRGTSDVFSATQFVAALLGYLVYEERDENPRRLSYVEAVALARGIDGFADGAAGFMVSER